MAYPGSKNVNEAKRNDDSLRLYAAAAAILVALAAVSMLLVHSTSGSAASRCRTMLFQQDRYGCAESLAVSTKNASMCAGLPGLYQDSCYLSIAVNTTDAALCSRINSSGIAGQCYLYMANYTGNVSMCTSIQGSAGSECAYMLALKTGSIADCASVLGDGRGYCNDTIHFNNALRYDNASMCAAMGADNSTAASESIMQNLSLSGYSGLLLNITQAVEMMVFYNQSIGARDICYAGLAYKTQNTTYCGYIQSNGLGSACESGAQKQQYSNSSLNSSAALNMTALLNSCTGTQQEILSCRYSYMSLEALQTGNVSICKSIPSNYSATCFYYLARKYNDTSYCGYIANATLNGACAGDISGAYPTSTNTSG